MYAECSPVAPLKATKGKGLLDLAVPILCKETEISPVFSQKKHTCILISSNLYSYVGSKKNKSTRRKTMYVLCDSLFSEMSAQNWLWAYMDY